MLSIRRTRAFGEPRNVPFARVDVPCQSRSRRCAASTPTSSSLRASMSARSCRRSCKNCLTPSRLNRGHATLPSSSESGDRGDDSASLIRGVIIVGGYPVIQSSTGSSDTLHYPQAAVQRACGRCAQPGGGHSRHLCPYRRVRATRGAVGRLPADDPVSPYTFERSGLTVISMWRRVAPALAKHFTVVVADIRGQSPAPRAPRLPLPPPTPHPLCSAVPGVRGSD